MLERSRIIIEGMTAEKKADCIEFLLQPLRRQPRAASRRRAGTQVARGPRTPPKKIPAPPRHATHCHGGAPERFAPPAANPRALLAPTAGRAPAAPKLPNIRLWGGGGLIGGKK